MVPLNISLIPNQRLFFALKNKLHGFFRFFSQYDRNVSNFQLDCIFAFNDSKHDFNFILFLCFFSTVLYLKNLLHASRLLFQIKSRTIFYPLPHRKSCAVFCPLPHRKSCSVFCPLKEKWLRLWFRWNSCTNETNTDPLRDIIVLFVR